MANADSTITTDTKKNDGNTNSYNTTPTSNDIKTWTERFEIVSLVGTLSTDAKHLHLCISDKDGNAFGGHLISGRVFTTVELVLGTVDGVMFTREHDPATRYQELCIASSKHQ
jgi:predicted DNA-binding protein with PD1-like motif